MSNVASGKRVAAQNPGANAVAKPDKKALKAEKNKQKKAKTPGKQGAVPRRLSPLRSALIVTVFFLLALCIVATFLFFDFGGSRQLALRFLQVGEHPYQNQMNALLDLQEQIRQEKLELTTWQEQVAAREKDVQKTERSLAARESAVAQREEQMQEQQTSLDTGNTELAKLVAIYEKLDASTAAKILEEMKDIDEVTRILSRMKDAAVADILTAMSQEFAARVSLQLAP